MLLFHFKVANNHNCEYIIRALANAIIFRFTRDLPSEYPRIEDVPVLQGSNHCIHCLCSPCVVVKPPFLRLVRVIFILLILRKNTCCTKNSGGA